MAAENLTMTELCVAPELSTLVALDASLLAAIQHLELQTPYLACSRKGNRHMTASAEEHIAESIVILGSALRANLLAYYAAIRQDCDEENDPREVEF